MKLSFSKTDLLEALSSIQNIVEKRNTMPILSHFLLKAEKEGANITATDLETALRLPVRAEVKEGGRLAIPARKLFEIAKEVEGDVSLESADAQWIKAKAGKSTFRLACLSADEFPVWPEMEEAREMKIEGGVLSEMIEKTVYSAGESDTRYTLNGLLFHISEAGKTLTMVGTDGHRMAVIKRDVESSIEEELKVIVPRKAASELKKFLGADSSVTASIGQNHVLFRAGEAEFLARLIEGAYPNYSQVLPEKNEKKVLADREALARALRRVSVMSRERSGAVRLDLSGGSATLSSSNPDLGEARDEMEVEYAGEDISLGFNARYLIDALGTMNGKTVSLELQDPLSPTLLREEGETAYRCVIMPMRI